MKEHKISVCNARYPLMEYLLERKPLHECSAICQQQVVEILQREGDQ